MRKPLWTLGALHHSPRALADADSAEMRLPLPGGDHNNNGCGWAMGVDGQGQKTCTVNNIFGNPPTLDCPTQPQHLLLPSPALHHSASPLPTYSHSPPLPHCSPPFTSTPYYTTQPQHILLPSPSPLSLTPLPTYSHLLPLPLPHSSPLLISIPHCPAQPQHLLPPSPSPLSFGPPPLLTPTPRHHPLPCSSPPFISSPYYATQPQHLLSTLLYCNSTSLNTT